MKLVAFFFIAFMIQFNIVFKLACITEITLVLSTGWYTPPKHEG